MDRDHEKGRPFSLIERKKKKKEPFSNSECRLFSSCSVLSRLVFYLSNPLSVVGGLVIGLVKGYSVGIEYFIIVFVTEKRGKGYILKS